MPTSSVLRTCVDHWEADIKEPLREFGHVISYLAFDLKEWQLKRRDFMKRLPRDWILNASIVVLDRACLSGIAFNIYIRGVNIQFAHFAIFGEFVHPPCFEFSEKVWVLWSCLWGFRSCLWSFRCFRLKFPAMTSTFFKPFQNSG